jgi:lipopolysaccharide export system permease protein
MKTLHLYLTRQVLATLFMTIVVFTFVLLLGNVLKEIIELLISRQATLGTVAQAIALLIPWVLAFALPMGMLTAALLVFGRLSADQELTAVRSSGVSLMALITPVLLLSLALCGLSAFINLQVAPQCRVAYKNLINQKRANLSGNIRVPAGRFVKDFKDVLFYIGKSDGQHFEDVHIYHLTNNIVDSVTHAQRGSLEITNQQAIVHLFEVVKTDLENPSSVETTDSADQPFDLKPAGQASGKPPLSDMTFFQLQRELRSLEQMLRAPKPLPKMSHDEMLEQKHAFERQKLDVLMPVLVQLHRQAAFSFACFGFTLVGIPLGVRAHRRETNIGVAMALALVLIYYSFMILGESMQTHAEWAPYLIVWFPNFLFQAAGAVMLWRANRGI